MIGVPWPSIGLFPGDFRAPFFITLCVVAGMPDLLPRSGFAKLCASLFLIGCCLIKRLTQEKPLLGDCKPKH